jgi:hypothetical protein
LSIASGQYHFLARPRRFGKSLLCSTIAELFHGDADMFKGLFIYDKWDFEAEKRPVIHMKMDLFPSDDAKSFAIRVSKFLRDIALKQDLSLNSGAGDVHDLLSDSVMQLHRKHGKKVVVIIDEYDAPLHAKYPEGNVETAIVIIVPTGLLIVCGKDELTITQL